MRGSRFRNGRLSPDPKTVNPWRRSWAARVMAQAKEPGRAERLKAALRENLKRRKAQARDRRDGPPDAAATDKRDSPAD
jgi:hypothetical protein